MLHDFVVKEIETEGSRGAGSDVRQCVTGAARAAADAKAFKALGMREEAERAVAAVEQAAEAAAAAAAQAAEQQASLRVRIDSDDSVGMAVGVGAGGFCM